MTLSFSLTTQTLNQPAVFKSKETAQYTALVPYQAKYEQREFGFIPDSLPVFQMMPIATEIKLENSEKWLNQMYTAVKEYNLPNYRGARIPVPSGLNIPMWRYILTDYDLPIIGDYLQFGFPINIDLEIFKYNTDIINHKSTLQTKEGVCKYFTTEVSKRAIMGSFDHKPFERIHYSPLMA